MDEGHEQRCLWGPWKQEQGCSDKMKQLLTFFDLFVSQIQRSRHPIRFIVPTFKCAGHLMWRSHHAAKEGSDPNMKQKTVKPIEAIRWCSVANVDGISFTELPREIRSPIVHIYSFLFFNSGEGSGTPLQYLLSGKSHGCRSLVGCSPWGRTESDTTECLHFHFSLSCIGEGNGNPLQCSCLENPRDEGTWWAAVYGVAQSRTRLGRLSSSSSLIPYHLS